MIINTNASAQAAATNLANSSQLLSKSLARLSSGSKIVSPADDAAGLAVSSRFDAQILRTSAAVSNLGNATSFSQTQDGFLQKIGSALDRMSELAISAQDVTKTDSDRSLYNKEFQTLAAYISNTVTKDFNGVSLFSSAAANVTTDSEGGTFAMAGITANYLPITTTTTTTSTSTVGYAATTSLGQVLPAFNTGNPAGDQFVVLPGSGFSGSYPQINLTPASTIGDLVNFLNNDTFGATTASYNASTGQLSLTVAAGARVDDWRNDFGAPSGLLQDLGMSPTYSDSFFDVDSFEGPMTFSTSLTHSVTTTSTTTTSNGAPDISTVSSAAAALATIKTSIDQLASDRATVGANQSRLNYTSDQLGALKQNLTAANSIIKDVDVARESTQYARYNILVQAGTSMLAQANNIPQSALKLLS